MLMPTYKEVVDFIRRHSILQKWTDIEICSQIMQSVNDKCIAFSLGKNNELLSICLARWHDKCSLHIVAIAGSRGCLKDFIQHVKCNYSTVTHITGERAGVIKTYKIK